VARQREACTHLHQPVYTRCNELAIRTEFGYLDAALEAAILQGIRIPACTWRKRCLQASIAGQMSKILPETDELRLAFHIHDEQQGAIRAEA
jgi:hypothetical protein